MIQALSISIRKSWRLRIWTSRSLLIPYMRIRILECSNDMLCKYDTPSAYQQTDATRKIDPSPASDFGRISHPDAPQWHNSRPPYQTTLVLCHAVSYEVAGRLVQCSRVRVPRTGLIYIAEQYPMNAPLAYWGGCQIDD